ncbi:MAG: ATP-binding protein [Bacteroidota bacterium]
MSHKIYELIAQGEHIHQDFKYEIEDAHKIAKSIVAFANTEGGRLLIGVKDNGRIKGVHSDEELHMAEAAAEVYSVPEVHFDIRRWSIEGKEVLEIYIPKSKNRPHFVKNQKGPNKAYVRVDDMNIAVNKVMLAFWELEKKPKDKEFLFSENETKLFDYLKDKGQISFSKYCRITNLHFEEAANRLAKLLLWEVVDLDLSEKGCFYTINPKKIQD